MLLVAFTIMLTISAQGTTLFNFDNTEKLKQWNVRKGTELSIAPWPDDQSVKCGKIIFHKYKAGQDNYPGIVMADIHPANWQNVKIISFDIYAEKNGSIGMQLRNQRGEKVNYILQLKPGKNQIRQKINNLDKEEITQLHLFIKAPDADLIYYISNIQLIESDEK